MAAGAPLRALAADPVGHELDALPVERVVERGETVRRPLPLVEGVGVARLAVVVGRELLRPSRRPWSNVSEEEGKKTVSPFTLTIRLGGFSSRATTAIAAEEHGDRAAPGEEPRGTAACGVRAAVEDERDQRQRHRRDVREPDPRLFSVAPPKTS